MNIKNEITAPHLSHDFTLLKVPVVLHETRKG